MAVLGSKAVPGVRKVKYWADLYNAEVVKEWVAQAKRILKKDLSEALYETVEQYKRT